MVAWTLLLIALAAILGSFAQAQQTASAEDTHTQALDGLRQAVDVFAKDVRESTVVSSGSSTAVVMTTTVNEVVKTVTWRTTTVGGRLVLQRQVGTATAETMVDRLLVGDVFVLTPDDPASVQRILLTIRASGGTNRAEVDLSTEVTRRDAS
jgi:hypothetical protein